MRGFEFRGEHYLLGMPGVLYRSARPDGGFLPRDRLLFEPDMRHAALWVEGNTLNVLWSRGEIDVATRELRDPYLLRDSDGRHYLYYVGAGEKAIGVALVHH